MVRRFARPLLILAGLWLTAAPARAQTDAVPSAVRDSIVGVVEQFFAAMKARDTAALARTMLPSARSDIIEHRGDSTVIGGAPMSEFLAQLPSIEPELVERMWDPQVLEHRGLAVVWTPYDFHIGGRFSHCGVDAFTLLRTPVGWRISGVAYTVEREGCRGR